MTLSVSEATAVNVLEEALLDFLGAKADYLPWAQRTHHARARKAALLLADAAHKRLGAGPQGSDVAKVWERYTPKCDPALPATGLPERMARIADLLGPPCPAPDVANGYDRCPCATGGTWPCPRTEAVWLATGRDRNTEVAKVCQDAAGRILPDLDGALAEDWDRRRSTGVWVHDPCPVCKSAPGDVGDPTCQPEGNGGR